MKRLFCALVGFVIALSVNVTVFAATAVPESVLDATRSVVRIVSEYVDEIGTGTGFVIKSDSNEILIATNYHVVQGNPQSIYTFIGEDIVYAEIVAYTEQKDMCILRLNESCTMKPLKLAKETSDRGEAVYAVGFPGAADSLSDNFAYTSEDVTITDGIISAVREMTPVSYGSPVKYLQITADINSGNSGGPLFNTKGEVIGINTLGVDESQGIFGAIDILELEAFAQENNIQLSAESDKMLVILVFVAALLFAVLVFLVVLIVKSEKREKSANTTEDNGYKASKKDNSIKAINLKKSVLLCAVFITIFIIFVYINNYESVKKYAMSEEFGTEKITVTSVLKFHDSQLYEYIMAGNLLADKNYDRAKTAFMKMSGFMNAEDMVLECDYCYAAYLADAGEFSEAIMLYRQLGQLGYKDSYSKMNATNYRKACYIMEEQGDYIGAYKIIKSIDEFATDEILMAEFEDLIYTHGQYLYYQEDYYNARECFRCVSDYSDARKYLQLIEVRWTQDILVNAKNIAQDLINNFYFEDTNVVVLENDSVAGEFLKGEWTTEDGYYGFEIKNDGSAFNSLPQVQDHSYYYIYQGEWLGYNTSKSDYIKEYKLKAVTPECLEVYCYADNKTYILYRK